MVNWKPNLFIPGFPKCGTTALASYLSQHPDIYVIESKEPGTLYHWKKITRFMIPNPLNPHIGKPVSFEAYKKAFELNKHKKIKVDASQAYSFDLSFVGKLHEFNPEAKIIIMIRDPISRVISTYNFTYHVHRMNFNNWINNILIPDLDVFKYYNYIKECINVFGEKNVLIIDQRKLKDYPITVMNKIFNWLNLKPFNVKPTSPNISMFGDESTLIKCIKIIIFDFVRLITRPFVFLIYTLNLHKTHLFLKLRQRHPLIFVQNILGKIKSKKIEHKLPQKLRLILLNDYKKTIKLAQRKGILEG